MAKFTTKDDKITITFEYTALTTKVQPIIEDCAESLWVEETEDEVVTNPFSKATNQEKLDVVDAYVKRILLDMSNSWKSNEAQRKARETEADSEHVI